MKQDAGKLTRLERDFFTVDGLTLARRLLGKVLVHDTPYGTVRGIITETEAYMGVEDKGSHTFGGRRTDRTEPMFHIGGTSYVYLIYGMYSCMNVAAGAMDVPQAVLIRMAEPLDAESEQIMMRLRMDVLEEKRRRKLNRQQEAGNASGASANLSQDEAKQRAAERNLRKHLADGPGRLCIAMGITRTDNDIDMVSSDRFYWTEGMEILPEQIEVGKRIGIDYAEEAADYLWRFTVKLRR